MKKILNIVGITALLLLCCSGAYYFITKANIDKQSFSIQNNEYIEQKSKDCMEEFHQYYEYNNYDRSYKDYGDFINGIDYKIDDIKYSPETNSCIQFWYSAEEIADTMYYQYKITDETNKTNIYYCSNAEVLGTSKEECEEGYNKKLMGLGIK